MEFVKNCDLLTNSAVFYSENTCLVVRCESAADEIKQEFWKTIARMKMMLTCARILSWWGIGLR